jgi:hypothetical protein
MAKLWGGGLTYRYSMVEKRLFEYKRLGPSLVFPSHDIDEGARRVASCTDARGINFWQCRHVSSSTLIVRACSHKITGVLAHYSMKSSAQRWKGRSKVATSYR